MGTPAKCLPVSHSRHSKHVLHFWYLTSHQLLWVPHGTLHSSKKWAWNFWQRKQSSEQLHLYLLLLVTSNELVAFFFGGVIRLFSDIAKQNPLGGRVSQPSKSVVSTIHRGVHIELRKLFGRPLPIWHDCCFVRKRRPKRRSRNCDETFCVRPSSPSLSSQT